MRKTSRWIASIVLATAAHSPALGQSLEQTAGYILNGGFVEIEDMQRIDNDTLQIPGYYVLGIMMALTTARLTVLSRQDCQIMMSYSGGGQGKATLYLNNVILEETTQRHAANQLQDLSVLYLNGQDSVGCIEPHDQQRTCQRSWDITTKTEALPRIHKALDYLFSTFCTSARRKSAF